jgi:hypothetical protein
VPGGTSIPPKRQGDACGRRADGVPPEADAKNDPLDVKKAKQFNRSLHYDAARQAFAWALRAPEHNPLSWPDPKVWALWRAKARAGDAGPRRRNQEMRFGQIARAMRMPQRNLVSRVTSSPASALRGWNSCSNSSRYKVTMACAVSRPQAFFDVSAVTAWAVRKLNASRCETQAPCAVRLELFALAAMRAVCCFCCATYQSALTHEEQSTVPQSAKAGIGVMSTPFRYVRGRCGIWRWRRWRVGSRCVLQTLVAPSGVTRHVECEWWLLHVADHFVFHLSGSNGLPTERADFSRRTVPGSHALRDTGWKTPAVELLPGGCAKVGVRRVRPGGHTIRSPKVGVPSLSRRARQDSRAKTIAGTSTI